VQTVVPERTVEDELAALRSRLRAEQRLLVAFSGGVDSALVAAVAAQELGERAVAVTAVSASLPRSERTAARAFAAAHGIAHVEVATDELERPEYVANGGDRCYHCKSALFDAIGPLADLSGARIALGTNTDDLGDHRPGQAAAVARGAIAPLLDVGFGKVEVRRVSQALGLATAQKPAAACLSSRVAYGDPVTPEVLHRIEKAEEAVRGFGFAVCRVRAHAGGSVARVEVPDEDVARAASMHSELDAAIRAAGFEFCALDMQGFASGRMNVLLGMPSSR
jgi:pyridinium-3,5-biscarboxylic acid mononucleotide sulfurtransferase